MIKVTLHNGVMLSMIADVTLVTEHPTVVKANTRPTDASDMIAHFDSIKDDIVTEGYAVREDSINMTVSIYAPTRILASYGIGEYILNKTVALQNN